MVERKPLARRLWLQRNATGRRGGLGNIDVWSRGQGPTMPSRELSDTGRTNAWTSSSPAFPRLRDFTLRRNHHFNSMTVYYILTCYRLPNIAEEIRNPEQLGLA